MDYGVRVMSIKDCGGGHVDLIDYMIALGADDWLSCCCAACRGGQFDIVKMMFEKCKQTNIRNSESLIRYACWGGKIEIVNYIISEINFLASNEYMWNIGLTETCKRKKQLILSYNLAKDKKRAEHYDKIIELMIKKGATRCDFCRKTLGEH